MSGTVASIRCGDDLRGRVPGEYLCIADPVCQGPVQTHTRQSIQVIPYCPDASARVSGPGVPAACAAAR